MEAYQAKKQSDLFNSLMDAVNSGFSEGHENDYSEYVEDPEGFCLNVLNDKYLTPDTVELMEAVVWNRVTLGKSGNALGKSFTAARIALWFYFTRERSQVYLAAAPPLSNLSNILFGEIGTILARNPDIAKGMKQKTMHIERSPGSFLTGLSIPSSGTREQRIAKFSGKHAPDGVLFVFDEASAIPDECFSGAETCASDDKSRRLGIFNPHPGASWTYRTERDRQAKIISLSAFNHPQVIEDRDDITPGAVTRGTTVLRISQWCRPLADGELSGKGTFVLPDFLVGAVTKDQQGDLTVPLIAGEYKIVEPAFSTVVLGEYPAAGSNSLISQEWIDAARSRWDAWVAAKGETPPEFVKAVVGCDIAEFGDDSSVMYKRYGGFVPNPDAWQGLDPQQSELKIAELLGSEKVQRVCVDGTGLGSGVAPHLSRDYNLPAITVKVAKSPTGNCEFGEFKILNDELAWKVREWLRTDNTAMLPPRETLLEELAAYTYRVEDDGYVRVSPKSIIKALLKRSPDDFDGLKMTFYDDGLFSGMDLT